MDKTPETMSGAEIGAWIVREHNARRGYVVGSPAHGLAMLMADLIDYANSVKPWVDVEEAISMARAMLAEEQP